jgi:DNA adenine methylase
MPEHLSAWLSSLDNLPLIHARLRGVTVLPPAPAIEVLQRFDGPDVLLYCDPPYLHSTRASTDAYGAYEMSAADHRQLLDLLLRYQGQVLLSGYRSPPYDEALQGWHRFERAMPADSAGGKSKSRRIECLWCNRF